MCGLAGAFIPSNVGWLEPRELLPMIGALAHRGPDGMDYWINSAQTAMLMHARLALVDPAGGRQPLANEDGSVWLACNGEIYGYKDIMRELKAKKHKFRSACDVEVIPHLYETYGAGCFAKLRGEFAFALYDQNTHELYLVRDRFGIKPLYYTEVGSTVVFGSEIKSVLAYPSLPAELNLEYLRGLLAGITLPQETILDDIFEVPPGHYVRFSENGSEVRPYWTLAVNGRERFTQPHEVGEEFAGLFDEAVRLRLHGDAPVGAYLSSGVDSSSVVDAMARHANGRVKAFTIRFEDPQLDESQIASRVASVTGVEHQIVDVSNQALADNFRASLWHSEIPVFNTHGTAKHLLSRACQSQVKAVLTGEGADETLAGYAMYRHQLLLDESRKTGERGVRDQIKEMIAREGILAGLLPVTAYRKKAMVEAIFGCYPYAALRALTTDRFLSHVLDRGFVEAFPMEAQLQRLADALPAVALEGLPPSTASRFISLKCDLPAYNLNYLGDRQEMANSIEGRLPFLDNELADFALQLPPSALHNAKDGKIPLRTAMANRLPNYVHQGPKRMFWAPVAAVDTLMENSFCEIALSPEAVREAGVFNPSRVALAKKLIRVFPANSKLGSALRTALTLAASLHMVNDMFVRNFPKSAQNFRNLEVNRTLDKLADRGTPVEVEPL
ncbi:MAG: asparagine synthase (glutamine-hydrolyzing) [Pseudomonadota bacterium]